MHISNLTLADILTRDVACIDIERSAEAARQQLCDLAIGAMVVLAGRRPVGVITGRDLVRGHVLGLSSVREVMGPMWVEPVHADYRGAYRRMVTAGVRLLVVINAEGDLAGIVTEEGFMRHLGTEFLWHLRHVDQAMSTEVLVLEVPALAMVALQQLQETQASCLVLVTDGRPVGMLTERDLVRWLPRLGAETPVTALMTAPLESVRPTDSLVQACDQMNARRFSQLVVMDEAGTLLGLLRGQDIVRLIYERWVERLQSQEQLHLLHAFLDHSSEAFFVSRVTDGRLVYVNQQCCKLSGYTQAELLHMRVQDISDIYSTDSFTARLQEYRRAGRLVFETSHRCKGSRHVPVEVSLSYVPGPLGDHTVGVVRSLEERQRVATTLREAEERWKFAIEATDRGVWDWSLESDDFYFSPKWKAMLGFRDDELAHHADEWWSRVHPDDLKGVRDAVTWHLRGETEVYGSDHRLRCKDGSYRWVQSLGKVVAHTERGEPLRIIGTHTDITERKRIEAELALRESMARSLLRLSQALEAALTLQDILEATQQEVQLILALQHAWICRIGDAEPTSAQERAAAPLRVQAIMDTLVQSTELLYIPDVRLDPRTASMAEMGYGTLLGMSLCQHDVCLGVLGVATRLTEGVRVLSALELEYVTSLGGRVAAALERVRVHAELQQAVEQLRASEAVLRHAQSIAEVGHWVCDADTGLFSDSGPLARALGRAPHERFSFDDLLRVVHPDDRLRVIQHWKPVPDRQPREVEFRYLAAGQIRWVQIRAEAQFNEANWIIRVVGVSRDITTRRLAELIQRTRLAVLDRVVRADPLAQVLEEVAHRLEEVHAEWHIAIILLLPPDGRMKTVAAPTLPAWYTQIIDGLNMGMGMGSCGTAAYLGEPVWVEDVQTSAYWQDFRADTDRLGMRSCWSTPFKDEAGRVQGTFAVYRVQPGLPSQAEIELLTEFIDIAALAVQRVRAGEALRQAAAVFESTHDGVLITDLNANIVAVNQAYCRITGYGEQALLGQSPSMLQSGRHDPDFYNRLWTSVKAHGYWQGEMWNRHRSGELYPQWVTISTVRDERGEPSHYVGVCTDITRIKQSEQQLEHLAHYDPLTALPNRLLAQSRLRHALERASTLSSSTQALAVLFIDLDRFKTVNDSLGHPAGDELLAGFARRTQDLLSEVDTLARLGGDEFLLLLEDIHGPGQVAAQAQALLDALVSPFLLSSGQVLYVTASIGVSLYPEDGRTADELIQHADSAMYQAKAQGRNTYRFYTEALTRSAHERLELELQMRRALARDEFKLHYQPILPTHRDGWVGVEALLRWDCPGRGPVEPSRFITLAEETGLIIPLGEWVLRAACQQARLWLDAGEPLCVAVNLSARQFALSDLVKTIADILLETGLPPQWLELEITESILMEHPEVAIETLRRLRALGLRLSIDDFGTGYSSLAYLTRFTVDKLKIDQSFVKGLPQQHSQLAIVRAIITMAHSLGMVTLAEGVENAAQYRALRRAGCDLMQGHWFCPALPPEALQHWVAEARRRHTTCLVFAKPEKDAVHSHHPRSDRKHAASLMHPL